MITKLQRLLYRLWWLGVALLALWTAVVVWPQYQRVSQQQMSMMLSATTAEQHRLDKQLTVLNDIIQRRQQRFVHHDDVMFVIDALRRLSTDIGLEEVTVEARGSDTYNDRHAQLIAVNARLHNFADARRWLTMVLQSRKAVHISEFSLYDDAKTVTDETEQASKAPIWMNATMRFFIDSAGSRLTKQSPPFAAVASTNNCLQSKHELTGILYHTSSPLAVFGDGLYRIGDTLACYTITDIGRAVVVLRDAAGRQRTLVLASYQTDSDD